MVRHGSGIPPHMGYEPDYPLPPEMFDPDPYGPMMPPATQQQSLYLAQMQELERCHKRKAFLPKKPSEDEAVFVAMLCSEQDALYGTNMLEDITPDDRIYIDSLIARGVPENEALRLSFERKPHPYKVKNKPQGPDTEADRNALEQAIQASLTESSIRASQPDRPYHDEIDPTVLGQLEDVPRPSAKADEDALQAALRLSLLDASSGTQRQTYGLQELPSSGIGRAHSYQDGDNASNHYQIDNRANQPVPAPNQRGYDYPSQPAPSKRPSAIQMEINQRKALHASYTVQMQHQHNDRSMGNDVRGAIDAEMRAPPPHYNQPESASPPAYQANYNIQLSHQQLHTKSNPLKKSHSLVGRTMENAAMTATQLNANQHNDYGRHESEGSMASSITNESSHEHRRLHVNRASNKGAKPTPPAYSGPGISEPVSSQRPPMLNSNSGSSAKSPYAGIAHSTSETNLSEHSGSNKNSAHHIKYHVRGSLHGTMKEPQQRKVLPRHQSNSHLLELMEQLKDDDDDEPVFPVRTNSAIEKLLEAGNDD